MREIACRLARIEAHKSQYKQRLGAILVKGGKIIGRGFNNEKPRKIENGFFSLHAECAAIIRAKNPRGGEIYVYRLTRKGMPALAKPCAKCTLLLKESGIKRAFFTIDRPPFWDMVKL